MALPPPKVYRQDLPPTGGFQKPAGFPVAGYRKRSPARGPAGVALVGGVVGMMALSWYFLLDDIEERNYYNLARFNEKFERAYVMQAQEEVRWTSRQKEYLDNERALMAGVPGWVVGKRRYLTQWEDRPDRDVLDLRKAGPW